MKDTKLLRYYRTFSVEETKEWLTFVQSPYFNTNPNVVQLAKILRSYHPALDQNGLAKERVYKRIFGKEDYRDIKMRKLMSAAVKLIERYWVNKEVEGKELQYRRQLSHGYRNRDLFADYQKEMTALLKNHNERVANNPESYYDLHQLNWDLTADRQFLEGVDLQQQLLRASNALDRHIRHLSLLHYLIWYDMAQSRGLQIPNYLNNRPSYDQTIPLTPSENILLYIEDTITKEKMDFELFDNASLYLRDHNSIIEDNIRYYSYRLLFNYLIVQRRKGITIQERYIPLMQEAVERNAFIYRGKISIAIFLNLTAELSQNELLEEAEAFVKRSEHFLSGTQIQDIIKLAKSYILIHRQQYLVSYTLVSSYYFTGKPELELVRRTNQLRSSLASNNISSENTSAIADSFAKFVRRSRLIAPQKKRTFSEFISLIRRIQGFKIKPTNNSQKANLIRDIQRSKFELKMKNWLLNQVK